MRLLITCIIALSQMASHSFAYDTDFNTPGSLETDFNITQTRDRSFYEAAGEGLTGSRGLGFPFAPRSQVIATTEQPVITWGEGASVTVAAYFKAHVAEYQNKNRRAFSLGITNSNTVTPKPTIDNDPVFPSENTIRAGLFTRSFDLSLGTIDFDFHLTGSQPDKTYSLTDSPVTLKKDEWYLMEIRFVEKRNKLSVELSVDHIDADGQLIESIYKGEQGYGVTPVDFFYGEPVYAFIHSRDPQLSGVLTIDNFRAE